MSKGYILPKKQLNTFLEAVMALPKTALIAPLKRDCVKFDCVQNKSDLKNIDWKALPPFTAKKFFMPAYETLYVFDKRKQKIIVSPQKQDKKQVIFGMRLCDLNAVKVQDMLFLQSDYPDTHYQHRRKNTILIGYYCNTPPSEHCFCSSMQLTNYYDLLFRDRKDHWYIDVGSDAGEAFIKPLIKKLKLKDKTEDIPPIETKKRLNTHDIDRFYAHPKWKEVVESECLSCERCTQLCPTCMCFDVYDKVTDDMSAGKRERTWNSCHDIAFTRVAHNHYFRPSREKRFKHRIWHKLKYFPDVFGRTPMCTGCGRCIEHCPTKIDWVEHINNMEKGDKKNH